MTRPINIITVVFCLFSTCAFAATERIPARLAPSEAAIRGVAREAADVDQTFAARLFATAEAAIYFPEAQRIRWFDSADEATLATTTLANFESSLERDFSGYRANSFGPFLLKVPRTGKAAPIEQLRASPPATSAAAFADSFENGMGNWTIENNTLDLYAWGATRCAARSGSYSADPFRGGVNGLTCTDAYAPNVTSRMTHNSCESLKGSSQAWLDLYIQMVSETSYDTLTFYYADSSGQLYGYAFSGTWSGWFHLVMNLRQWYHIGDVTTLSCPKLVVEFESDEQSQPGYGARIDDLTISTAAPSFLACGITAKPATGAAPLAVSFSPVVSGASASAAYLWSFGDAAGTTASTSTASFTYPAAGDYNVRLRVEDQGTRAYAHTTIRVSAGSTCTVACSATVPATATAGMAVAFQSAATPTGCSGATTYAWQFGDGQTAAQQNPSHVYATAGTYAWSLTATAGGMSCRRNGSITVTSSGTPTTKRRRTILPPADTTAIATKTIGPSGGMIGGGGMTLTVPAGAFSGNASISLMRVNRARRAGELAPIFGIQGLPNTLSADLTLKYELDANPPALGSGESVMISFGGLALDRDATVSSHAFLLPATVSGRTVTGTLKKNWGSPSLAAAAARSGAVALASKDPRHESTVVLRTTVANDHFTISALPADAAWARGALTTLEQAYQRLVALGFSWGCRQPAGGAFVKIPVYVDSLGTGEKDPYGEQVSRLDPCGTGWVFTDYININKDFPVATDALRATIGHELFHELQQIYLPTEITNPNRSLWVAEASSTWFETLMVPDCPGVMSSGYQFAWNGLFNAAESAVEGSGRRKVQNHGYGASALLKHHSDASAVQNDPFVNSLWTSLKGGNSELEALQNAIGGSLPAYWTQFARDFFSGKAGCSNLQMYSKRAAIKDATTLAQTFKFTAHPLSAISFQFDLQKLEIKDKTPLPIIAQGLGDGQTVYVYDAKSRSELAQLTKTSSTYAIEDITAFKGGIIVLIFVDANLPGSSTTNEVTLTTGNTYKCYAIYYVKSFKEPSPGGGYSLCTGNCRVYDGSVSEIFVGELNGDAFDAKKMFCLPPPYSCRWTDPILSGVNNHMSFKLTNKQTLLENFLLTTYWRTTSGTPYTQSLSSAQALPRLSSSPNAFQYKMNGAGVCSAITLSSAGIYDIVCDSASYFLVSCEAYSGPSY